MKWHWVVNDGFNPTVPQVFLQLVSARGLNHVRLIGVIFVVIFLRNVDEWLQALIVDVSEPPTLVDFFVQMSELNTQ